MKSIFSSKTPRGTATPRNIVGEFVSDGSFVCAIGSLTVEEVALARVNFKQFDADGNPSAALQIAQQDRLANWRTLQEMAGIL